MKIDVAQTMADVYEADYRIQDGVVGLANPQETLMQLENLIQAVPESEVVAVFTSFRSELDKRSLFYITEDFQRSHAVH